MLRTFTVFASLLLIVGCGATEAPPDIATAPAALELNCRDGADQDGDGAADCADPECASDPYCATCGNGAVDPPESCDDGNTAAGDGCSATCRLEAAALTEAEPNDTQADAFPTGLSGLGIVTVQGAVSPMGDDDVFSFGVPAGQTLRLTARTFSVATQPNGCDSARTDTRLFVERAGVEVTDPSQPGAVAFNDDIDNAQNVWCSAVSGVALSGGASGATYYVRVQGWRDRGAAQYFLRLTLAP